MNFFNTLLEVGVDSKLDVKTIRYIKISNGLCFFSVFNVATYVTIMAIFMPEFVTYFILMGVFAVLALLCNKLQLYSYCKLICVTATPLIASIYHIHILKIDQPLHTGVTLIQLSLLVIPWILYDAKSKFEMYFGIFFGTLCIFVVHPFNYLIEPTTNTDILSSPLLLNIQMFSACFIATTCLFINQSVINEMDGNNEELINISKSQNELLQKKESELTLYIEELKEKQEQDKKQEWINVGIAQCADILRHSNLNISEFSMQVLRFLVSYLQANQGSFFILNDENQQDQHLELTACYAYNRKKHHIKRIEIGDGLVGVAYLEKDTIYLTEIPKDYISITSGLGEALPRCLIILPLMINDAVFGVVELAFFKRLEKHQIDLLKKLSENIAATVKNVKTNEITNRLLENSQQQSEALRAQEEEMRQNMEEMQATQEEMERKQVENLEFQRMTNSIIKSSPGAIYRSYTDTNWTMIFISEKVSQILGYSPEEFLNNTVQLAHITHPDDILYVEKEVYRALKTKTQYDLKYRLKRKDSRYIHVWEIGEGIYDAKGNPEFIEGIILDVNENKIKEEEVTRNVKVMQATQEEMCRKEEEYEKSIATLNLSHQNMVEDIRQNELHLKSIKEELVVKLTTNNVLIDIAGRQRMLSQKIGFYSQILFNRSTPKTIVLLSDAIELHNQSLLVIKNGGLPPKIESNEPLEAADESLWPHIDNVEAVWNEIESAAKHLIQGVNSPQAVSKVSMNGHLELIEEKSETLLKLNNELLQKCIEWNKNKVLTLYNN